ESGETLVQWCEKKDIKIHTMKYWLRKQSPVSKKSQETAWVSCLVEEPS
ncbi:IS66 family insertion sequence element accessory protein TnpA, partial [Planococcus wigleyi]